ncbi:hypothetical protein BYT27DRAFT_7249155 [Phlegmacium glaucopus]|nr:hypothetical protein BYT27DRAFT_7249155 [Phlegmacium glaucopus]
MDPQEVSPQTSNSQLAALLAEAFRDVDSLRRELSVTRKRAERAERLLQALNLDPTGSPPSAHPNGDQQVQKQTVKLLIDEYEDRLAQAEVAREEAESRRRVAQESWEQVERYLALVESRAKDARIAFTRISEGSVAPLVLPPLPPHIGTEGATYPLSSSSQIMAPPNVPRQHSRQHQSNRQSAAFPVLPPHPIPNPNPNSSPNAGTRRPRTPSMDGLYNPAQPPPKRLRSSTDDQRTRETRPSYSESYVGTMQQQQQQHLQLSSDSRDYQEQLLARARQQQLIHRSQAPRIIKYPDPHGQHPSQRPDSHGHSRSSSTSSLDVDEMLLRATTGDEHGGGGTSNGTGAPYIDSPHHHHLGINQRRRNERDGDSPRPQTANNNNLHPGHITPATNPYPPQHPSNITYPANQSAPVMSSLSAPAQSSQNQVIQTHIFAPVVTGAPTKKTKFPNTIQAGPGSGVGLPGSGPSLDTGSTPSVTVPFASTNNSGQRICRQCGMVGRYKDGKCVEKWGPGPMGPGTVCDRCRKKMKRVERRGTLENQQQQVASQSVQQQPQHQQRQPSHPDMPLSQGSDRSIHRSDTILTHQPSHGPATFSQSQPHSQSNRDRDASSSSHTQSNIRSSLSNLHPSSSASTSHSTKHGSSQRQQPPQSPPPSIAALKEPRDDDDERHDPDQLPISNVGRGGSGPTSRSSSRNARVRGGTGTRPTPPATRSSDNTPTLNGTPTKRSPLGSSLAVAGGGVESGSPTMEVDEMDADADADAEAEAEVESDAEAEILGAVAATSRDRTDGEEEGGDDGDGEGEVDADADAELLEAVDAAEANSSSSHGGERMRMKSES